MTFILALEELVTMQLAADLALEDLIHFSNQTTHLYLLLEEDPVFLEMEGLELEHIATMLLDLELLDKEITEDPGRMFLVMSVEEVAQAKLERLEAQQQKAGMD
jgi:hypothetical protein